MEKQVIHIVSVVDQNRVFLEIILTNDRAKAFIEWKDRNKAMMKIENLLSMNNSSQIKEQQLTQNIAFHLKVFVKVVLCYIKSKGIAHL